MGSEKINKRCGSLIRLRPEYEERYIILHRNTFPGVLSQIRNANIRNYSIFLLDGVLFSYYEYTGENYEKDMKSIADQTTRDWWKLTDPMQEPFPDRKEGEWWTEMELLLSHDENDRSSSDPLRFGLTADVKSGLEESLKSFFKIYQTAPLPEIRNSGIQNCNFYYRSNKIYFYSEYVGDNLERDFSNLFSNESFRKMQDELNRLLIQREGRSWRTMREVFHTN